jgi:hypothetical protein
MKGNFLGSTRLVLEELADVMDVGGPGLLIFRFILFFFAICYLSKTKLMDYGRFRGKNRKAYSNQQALISPIYLNELL